MNKKLLLTIATIIAILPLLIGSLIFWLWFFNPSQLLEIFGFWTIFISAPICLTLIVILVVLVVRNKSDHIFRKKASRVNLLLLSNMPVALFYIFYSIYLHDVERITFINDTGHDISELHVFGAGDDELIENLKAGESKTVWVYMTEDGSIQMSYKDYKQLKQATLNEYIGPILGGHKYDYSIR